MSRVYQADARLGAPMPTHTLTESAEAARQAVRQYVHERNLDRELKRLVTRHGQPKAVPMPANAKRIEAAARRKGFEVEVVTGHWALNVGKVNERSAYTWTVAGLDRTNRRGFRAVWVDGKAQLGAWYDPLERDVGVSGVDERIKGLPDA